MTTMAKRAYHTAVLCTPRGRAVLTIGGERRRAIREAVAAKIEADLAMAEFDDAADCVTQSDRNYLNSVVLDVIRQLREA
jgi:hypothetical protein